jgi:hypothetical protein
MTPFIHTPLPTRVLFGRGFSAKVGAEAERLGLHRPLVLTGRQQSELGRARSQKNSVGRTGAARACTRLSIRLKPRWTSFAPKARTARWRWAAVPLSGSARRLHCAPMRRRSVC